MRLVSPALNAAFLLAFDFATYERPRVVRQAEAALATQPVEVRRNFNGQGIGGVPALFEAFAAQAGCDYAVSLEAAPGESLGFHLPAPWAFEPVALTR